MSVYDDIQTAAVIRYPYLWHREAGKSETEGRKERPVAVGVRIARVDGDLVLFFPITTRQPTSSVTRSISNRSRQLAGSAVLSRRSVPQCQQGRN